MFKKVLIANRGAIAERITRSLHKLGCASVVLYSDADADSLHTVHADHAIHLPGDSAAETYLNTDLVFTIAQQHGVEAIHPGYGFLSENVAFAERCEAAGIAFIGPTPDQINDFGLKHRAKALAEQAGVPLLPGTDLLDNLDAALIAANDIGYPVMLKSTAGGGGIGMSRCNNDTELSDAFDRVKRLGEANFSHSGIFLEKFIESARHVEVQIFGDGTGEVIALGERDCSLQRRNQKVTEETPAPGLSDAVRAAMQDMACALGRSVNYRSAGTVEYLYDAVDEGFYFLEVNTRLQVEHGVTEAVTGVDLVAWMVQLAAGEDLALTTQSISPQGHSLQVRVYAEDPSKDFQPSSGLLTEVVWPADTRCDHWIESGVTVSPYYDPMLAKIIVHTDNRDDSFKAMQSALADTRIAGIETNLEWLSSVLHYPPFIEARHDTATLNHFAWSPVRMEVLNAGTLTTVQDWPARQGYWDIGVPPSGPMDSLAMRLGNRLLDNTPDCAALEITLAGPTLRFHNSSAVCVTGADIPIHINGVEQPMWTVLPLAPGDELQLGQCTNGARAYLCIAGGIDVPLYLGSRSTFTLGQFGGHGGRALRVGDMLPIAEMTSHVAGKTLAKKERPAYGEFHELRVIYGPHGADEFFTDDGMNEFFASDWEVHFNSSRTGVRLIGPKPLWAREDGGEAGLHPSNIHDNAYAIGAVDFTGDMPVILGPDGPSLGGFVCPVVIVQADLWKTGQLKAGDRLRFVPISQSDAEQMLHTQESWLRTLKHEPQHVSSLPATNSILHTDHIADLPVMYRPAGDAYILIELGEQILDIALRFTVHALWSAAEASKPKGVLELTPGIRSLQVHFNPLKMTQAQVMDWLIHLNTQLQQNNSPVVDTRIVHLPLAWNESQTRLAIEKYMQTVRADAPWCPENLEFIRRMNGLDSIDKVKKIVFDASYLVMGLGDVYLGAPVATPLDPRHRLVTTKYNPARTWTPENAVGIGGSYMCVYGMEGPGGYQFVGRTLQMWNRYPRGAAFDKPWLLRFFDQIRFYPVSEEELMDIRMDFPSGRFTPRVEHGTFSLNEYQSFLADHQDSIKLFKTQQQQAFEEERARWAAAGQDVVNVDDAITEHTTDELTLADGEVLVESHVHGSVWKITAEENQTTETGDTLVILESMKMEIDITASCAGSVTRILTRPGQTVSPGTPLMVIQQ